jgi:sialate O-acetylesterase
MTGNGLAGGNIEFWPNNYGPENSAHVPNASGETYDFGDQPNDPADGYGSMQVHNHAAKQTLFALNHWSAGGQADIGIGNQPQNNPDWTFSNNAGTYQAKRLRVLVRTK